MTTRRPVRPDGGLYREMRRRRITAGGRSAFPRAAPRGARLLLLVAGLLVAAAVAALWLLSR